MNYFMGIFSKYFFFIIYTLISIICFICGYLGTALGFIIAAYLAWKEIEISDIEKQLFKIQDSIDAIVFMISNDNKKSSTKEENNESNIHEN